MQSNWIVWRLIDQSIILTSIHLIGLLLPIIGKVSKRLQVNPFILALGKTVGTGVIISLALIHLLLESGFSLLSPCMPEGWHDFEGYAQLFCCIGILGMHSSNALIMSCMGNSNKNKDSTKTPLVSETSYNSIGNGTDHPHDHKVDPEKAAVEATNEVNHEPDNHYSAHVHGGGVIASHGNAILRVQAYMLEFALSVHSIIIGIAVGIADEETLPVFIIAIVFHQFFEGVALGSRLVDAKELSLKEIILLAIIFMISAPIGNVIAVLSIESMNTNDPAYLITTGVLDSICSGILLYVGFILLVTDFADDIMKIENQKNSSIPITVKKILMHLALWIGFAIMAAIGTVA